MPGHDEEGEPTPTEEPVTPEAGAPEHGTVPEPPTAPATQEETGTVMDEDRVEKTRRLFLLGLIAAFAFLSFLVFKPFVSYVFTGLLFVYLVHPSYRIVRRTLKHPRIAAAIVLVVSFTILVAPLVWVTFQVADTVVETASFVRDQRPENVTRAADAMIDRAYRAVGLDPPETDGLGQTLLTGLVTRGGQFVQARAGDALEFAGSVALGLVVMLFVLYYGLVDGERLLAFLKDVSPLSRRMNDELTEEVGRTLDAVFLGHVIVSVVQGLVGGIGFVLFDVPNPVFWGFIMIIMSLIPVLGAFLVWVPAAVYLFVQGQTFNAVGLAVWGLLIVSTIDNVLRPKIVGSRADIHPVLVLVGVLGGIAAFGVIGLVLGPLVLALFIAIVNYWRRDYLPRYGPRLAHGLPTRDSDSGALAETLDQ